MVRAASQQSLVVGRIDVCTGGLGDRTQALVGSAAGPMPIAFDSNGVAYAYQAYGDNSLLAYNLTTGQESVVCNITAFSAFTTAPIVDLAVNGTNYVYALHSNATSGASFISVFPTTGTGYPAVISVRVNASMLTAIAFDSVGTLWTVDYGSQANLTVVYKVSASEKLFAVNRWLRKIDPSTLIASRMFVVPGVVNIRTMTSVPR
jgi:hypothetical protein